MRRTLELDGIRILAEEPDGWDGRLSIILAHGAGQNMDSPFMTFFHEGMAHLGHLSVKFNFPYMEAGRRAPDPQKKMRAVYAGVVQLVAEQFESRSILVGGKSMGGRVSSYIAAATPEIHGLVFLGYPLHPPGRTDKLRDEHLYGLEKPMLFISGTKDALARRELLEGVIERIGVRANLEWIDGGDHSFRVRKSDDVGRHAALAAIARWTEQF